MKAEFVTLKFAHIEAWCVDPNVIPTWEIPKLYSAKTFGSTQIHRKMSAS